MVLLNVAALEKKKGAHRILQVLPNLIHEIPKLKYFLFGTGAYESDLKESVKTLRLENTVRFLGTTSSLKEIYHMGDIFVLLADVEANSVATMEAMACGLPVVVSNRGGFCEMIEGSAGLLVNPDEPREITEAIRKLAFDRTLREAIGRSARALVLKKYTWSHASDQLLQIFEAELAETKPQKASPIR